jgi:hypothetical protein
MKLVHVHIEETMEKPKAKLPMDKDPVFLAQLRRDFIRDHNAKIRARKN